METIGILKIVFWVFIGLSCGAFGFFTARYLKTYKIFDMLLAKISGKVAEVDKIRRQQMEVAFRKKTVLESSVADKKIPIVSKLYKLISMSGIMEKIPGLTETAFIVGLMAVCLALFFGVARFYGNFPAILASGGLAIISLYGLSILAYLRKVSVEKQLLDFTNMVALTSRQYSNLIDIFGVTSDSFKGSLKDALEACYVQAKRRPSDTEAASYNKRSNEEIALSTMKSKFDSTQFSFVIDNLTLCSRDSGDYFGVAVDISKSIAIYVDSLEKRQAILRNSKVNITVMAALSIGIFFLLARFLELPGGLLSTQGGIIIFIAMIILYVYAMAMKAE